MNPDASYDVSLRRLFPENPTGSTVFTCGKCFAPVVDSQQGRQGHKDRLGHWPEERERA